jgi:hypothetical protein
MTLEAYAVCFQARALENGNCQRSHRGDRDAR